jgi:hypothetical protein
MLTAGLSSIWYHLFIVLPTDTTLFWEACRLCDVVDPCYCSAWRPGGEEVLCLLLCLLWAWRYSHLFILLCLVPFFVLPLEGENSVHGRPTLFWRRFSVLFSSLFCCLTMPTFCEGGSVEAYLPFLIRCFCICSPLCSPM